MSRILLSLCTIVRNEAKFLPRCLESVQGVVDEIVLGDTGSTDDTVAVAERYGARVVHVPWCGTTSAARNETLRHASGEWILALDADDALTAEARRKVRGLLRDAGCVAYMLNVRSPLQQPGGPAAVICPWPRLFRNHPAIRYQGALHERLLGLDRAGGRVVPTDLVVDHLGYHSDFVDQAAKLARNRAMLEAELAAKPEDPLVLFHLGETLGLAGRLAEAADCYRRAVALPGMAPPNAAAAYRGLANCLLGLSDLEGALQACREALARDPGFTTPHLLAALAWNRMGRPAEALEEIEVYLRLSGKGRTEGWRPAEYEFPPGLASALKGECLAALRRWREAETAYREALRRQPDSREALLGLARLHVLRGADRPPRPA